MGQIFHPSSNSISKVSIGVLVVLLILLIWKGNIFVRSPYWTQVGIARTQPVPFSHKHHVNDLGMDCRYCHTSVEQSAFAGIPGIDTCMTCHSQIWKETDLLAPIRKSWETGVPIQWTRVHDLADFVYFDHSVHVNKGVSCTTCHGQVDQMPLMWRENTLQMEWCLQCHRNPEKFLQPKETVFDPNWTATEEQKNIGDQLLTEYGIQKDQLMDCSVCHR